MALTDFIMGGQGGRVPPTLNPQSGTQQVLGSLDQVIGSNSPYLENARRRGMEVAGARGGINSSIAAGASERSALEAAMPLVQQGLNIDAERQNVQSQDWLSQQNFTRGIQASAFGNSLNMLNSIQEYALADPELYSPDIVSGYTNFFEKNAAELMKKYFGG